MFQQFTLFLQQTFELGIIINLPYLFLSIYLFGKRKDLLLAASKENSMDLFPKHTLPELQNWGSFKLRVHACSWWGLSRGELSEE